MNLYIDTETTGIDTSLDRVLQIAARLHVAGKVIEFNSYIIPDGFQIPEAARQIHGIDNEFATINGLPLSDALLYFALLASMADTVVGHHVEYDVAILIAEARRAKLYSLANQLENMHQVCTKKMSAAYLLKLGEPASRYDTKLNMMFRKLTKEDLVDAHDALTDVHACERVYQELVAA